jgi:hypothetical protein
MSPEEPPVGADNPPPKAKGTPAAAGLFNPVGHTVPQRSMTFNNFNMLGAETGNHNLVADVIGPVGSKKADPKRPF